MSKRQTAKIGDFDVGYCKPPKASQFKKGVSGNPRGRPRGSKNFASFLNEELAKPIVVVEDGERKTISKAKAAALKLVHAALSGDLKALTLLIAQSRAADVESHTPAPGLGRSEEDAAVIARLIARIQRPGP